MTEEGWRGEEGENAREDALCICTCTLHTPTQKKSCCVVRRGSIERALRCNGFRGEKETLVLGQDLTTRKSQTGNRSNNETMRRVERGEKRRRAAVLQDTKSIAVADFDFFNRVSWDGVGEIFKVAPLGDLFFFVENVGTVLGPKMC